MQPLSSKVMSEKMLWSLLKIMVSTGGSVSSSGGCEDLSSPESQIIKLLLGKSEEEALVPNGLFSPASVEVNWICYRFHFHSVHTLYSFFVRPSRRTVQTYRRKHRVRPQIKPK